MLLTLIRYAVFAVLVLCTLAAVGSWLVRTRRVNPFKPLGRFLKQSSEPLIRPVEARVYRWGGNPVNAPVWLNVFVERLWRSIKYEEVYLRAYDTVSEARVSIGRYLAFYNGRRPHSSLDRQTPDQASFTRLPQSAAA